MTAAEAAALSDKVQEEPPIDRLFRLFIYPRIAEEARCGERKTEFNIGWKGHWWGFGNGYQEVLGLTAIERLRREGYNVLPKDNEKDQNCWVMQNLVVSW